MPQLPSGIHVAVDTQPLADLLQQWHLEGASERLSGMKTIEDLYPLTRILELVPAQPADAPMEMLAGSLTPPERMVTRDTGYLLEGHLDGIPSWPQADRIAFRHFVESRVPAMLQSNLDLAKKKYADITKDFLRLVEELWMKEGVHPSQEAGWDDWPEDTDIDVFDKLVALVQCRNAVALAVPGDVPACNAVHRLNGFLSMASGALPWFPEHVLPKAITTQLSQTLRESVKPDAFAPDQREWWGDQVSIECNCLFDEPALEEFLMANAPKAYGVVRLAAISKPERTKS